MDFLERVVREKAREVGRMKKRLARANKLQYTPAPLLSKRLRGRKGRCSLAAAVKRANKKGRRALIAEVKVCSPSQGRLIAGSEDSKKLAEIIAVYSRYADAVSVVTDRKFFCGSNALLEGVSRLCAGEAARLGRARLPVLAKDFVVDECQIYDARAHGADAVLLIASLLAQHEIAQLAGAARSIGMEALVEVHSAAEMKKALRARAGLIGINSRDLRTLRVDSGAAKKILERIQKKKLKGKIIVAESGIESREDVEKLPKCIDAVLVGTALLRAKNTRAKFRELRGIPLVKVCGITSRKDALAAVRTGADLLGFNFYRGSPRCISPERAVQIAKALPGHVQKVGVFVNAARGEVLGVAKKCSLDLLQFHGDETAGYVNSFPPERTIKAIRVKNARSLDEINKYRCGLILLDAYAPARGYGGTGRALGRAVLRAAAKIRRKKVFISGGLNAANVGTAIRLARPYAVDACSCLEKKAGKKGAAKMKAFVKAVDSA